jgi:uncharacterized protein (TIGR02246 family)
MEQMTTSTALETLVDRSLQATLEAFNDAFNRFDAKEVASFWASDGTLLNPMGNYGEGRAGVERVFDEDARTLLGGTHSRFTIVRARHVGADCVLLDLDHDLQDARRPDGSTGPMKLHTIILAQRSGDGWKWLDARPYGFMPRTQQLH